MQEALKKTLWASADKLHANMDAAEYKHLVLGLIFVKYISDAFEAKHAEVAAQKLQGAGLEDLAHPPVNDSEWRVEFLDHERCVYSTPSIGTARLVLANGSSSRPITATVAGAA